MAEPSVYFQWGVSSFYGWGVYGLNLMLHTAPGSGRASPQRAVSTWGVDDARVALSPAERRVLQPSIDESNALAAELTSLGAGTLRIPSTVLHALGNDFHASRSPGDVMVEGAKTVGVIFAENAQVSPQGLERAAKYSTIIAGSSWSRSVLEAQGIRCVQTVLQGVDTTRFHPAPRRGRLAGRFVVFSGGKLEFRKGQDLVVQAFRIFAQRHPDALLMTSWSSPWAQYAVTVNQNPDLVPIGLVDGVADSLAWTMANGIPASQVLHLGPIPNAEMPDIFREADLGLFPNRAESGTNLVAMEAMACGVPCILSMNTGHMDLIGDGLRCLALSQPVASAGEGGGSCDVEEIVAVLEAAYARRDAAAEIGLKGAAFMQGLSWPRQIDALMAAISPARDGSDTRHSRVGHQELASVA